MPLYYTYSEAEVFNLSLTEAELPYREYDGDWTDEDMAPMPGAQVFVVPPPPAWDENDDLPF